MKQDPFSEYLAAEVGHRGPVSPAIQVRISLKRSRLSGKSFEAAWSMAIASVRWPHDTSHRREWKRILADGGTIEIWRAAYLDLPVAPRQIALARLVAA